MHSYEMLLKEGEAFLSAEEEAELVRRHRAGDSEATEHIVRTNLLAFVKMAKKHALEPSDIDDFVQIAASGFLDGLKRYDPKRGVRLMTFCFWWMRQRCQKAAQVRGRLGHMPAHWKSGNRISKEGQQFLEDLSRGIIPINVSRDSGLSADPEYRGASAPEEAIRSETQSNLDKALAKLDSRYARVLRLRSEGHTLAEISSKLDITKERVRQIETSALKKLAKVCGRDEPAFNSIRMAEKDLWRQTNR